jgi:membrane protease YdiL (CAAX protease family)
VIRWVSHHRWNAAAAALGVATLGAVALLPASGLLEASSTSRQALLLLLMAPVLEEIIFRLGLQDTLIRAHWPRWACVLVPTVAFAAAHWLTQPASAMAAATVLPGLLLAALYQHSRRLAPCVLLHATMNALWLGMSAAW